jgi:hypothetical protein
MRRTDWLSLWDYTQPLEAHPLPALDPRGGPLLPPIAPPRHANTCFCAQCMTDAQHFLDDRKMRHLQF